MPSRAGSAGALRSRALGPGARLLVADGAVAGLDVSIRADVPNLLAELRRALGPTLLFIRHDPAVVARPCRAVAVMHLERIVGRPRRRRPRPGRATPARARCDPVAHGPAAPTSAPAAGWRVSTPGS